MLWLVSLALTHALTVDPASPSTPPIIATPSPHMLLAAEDRRVRSSTPRINKLIADGMRRSPTFANLITALHRTNVIVYVEPTFALPQDMAGRLLFSTVAGNQRYLRVQIRATVQGDQLISLIAHELRHALEIAVEPSVVDQEGLAKLYRRIGESAPGPAAFDTEAARITGRKVRDELIG